MTKYDPTERHEVESFDVEYRRVGEMALPATIYRPKGEGPFPAIIDVHGGAWNQGSRMAGASLHTRLASTGLLVCALDFRLAPDHPYPAQVSDVNYGTRWLKAHAAELKADVSPLGGIGSSSGGHTIMLSSMRPEDPRYADEAVPGAAGVDAGLDYVVLCWSVLDSYARYQYAKETAYERLVRNTEAYFLTEEAIKEGNPTLAIERGERVRLAPALILQGTKDDNIPQPIPHRFVEVYRKAGGEIEAHFFEGMPHRFILEVPGPETEEGIALLKTFVARQIAARSPVA